MYGLGILGEKVSAYSTRIINAQRHLKGKATNTTLSQFYRSGTSIGANCSEAVFAQSKADFITKLHIALKESNENRYWLEVILQEGVIDKEIYDSMTQDCIEIQKLLSTIIMNVKANINNDKNAS